MQGSLISMKRSIPLAVFLTIITLGFYGFYWQAKQMSTVNALLKEEKYSFWKWLFLVVITFGLYHIYYEYEMASDIYELEVRYGFAAPNANLSVISLILTLIGFVLIGFVLVVDAIQQNELNKLIDKATIS